MDDLEIATDAKEQAGSIADGVERRLDPRVMALARTSGWIFNAVVMTGGFVALVISWLVAGPTVAGLVWRALVWLILASALTWLAERWPQIDYRHTFYRVDDLGIEIRRGVFWRAVVNIPRSRVQHTDVSQGPLERRFGLGTLVVFTAGTDHAKVSLQGLEYDLALRIRQHLLPSGSNDAV
ncbi:MAG TPA: PH domain-containing protein [Vicinamibacterales bacterium]|nr:PH domain-containing protein [Vicinamibacterales bacterium]